MEPNGGGGDAGWLREPDRPLPGRASVGEDEILGQTQGGAPIPPLPDPVQRALARAEPSLRSGTVERLFAYDLAGNEVLRLDGTQDEVKIPRAAYGMLRDTVVTHNHPGGHSFSEDDVITAVELDLFELRAVSRDFTFRLRRPERGWGGRAIDELQAAYDDVFRSIDELVASGMITQEVADRFAHHELAKRFAVRVGAQYRRHQEAQ
jgi:hypothetical protein